MQPWHWLQKGLYLGRNRIPFHRPFGLFRLYGQEQPKISPAKWLLGQRCGQAQQIQRLQVATGVHHCCTQLGVQPVRCQSHLQAEWPTVVADRNYFVQTAQELHFRDLNPRQKVHGSNTVRDAIWERLSSSRTYPSLALEHPTSPTTWTRGISSGLPACLLALAKSNFPSCTWGQPHLHVHQTEKHGNQAQWRRSRPVFGASRWCSLFFHHRRDRKAPHQGNRQSNLQPFPFSFVSCTSPLPLRQKVAFAYQNLHKSFTWVRDINHTEPRSFRDFFNIALENRQPTLRRASNLKSASKSRAFWLKMKMAGGYSASGRMRPSRKGYPIRSLHFPFWVQSFLHNCHQATSNPYVLL